jgi:nucleoside-diphosphate-sugar epimerase
LVTGAGGYVGSVLVPMLLDLGYVVRAIDRFFFGNFLPVWRDGLEIVKEDTRFLDKRLFADVDGVVDLVAISNDPSSEAFQQATWEINADWRIQTASLAKGAGVSRYILPSSCSIYGLQAPDVIVDENAPTNPLTTYARANEKAEQGTLGLANRNFCVVVLRQGTLFGYSPRMRFDLAINGMTYGAWKSGKLPLMRDGSQWRPMLHVQDAARALIFVLGADKSVVNGQIFNVGSSDSNWQIGPLGELVASLVPRDVAIEWYGDPDVRSYRASFDKIRQLGFHTTISASDGVREICDALERGKTDRTPQTITLEWYRMLEQWHGIIRDVERHGIILNR